jgi:hydrophobic/amphiphilic exporter-1 (mainly G- bacteria), HAE1 family
MLVISLIESTLVLPCHLAHRENLVFRVLGHRALSAAAGDDAVSIGSTGTHHAVHRVVGHYYLPLLGWSLKHPGDRDRRGLAALLMTVGLVRSGITVPYVLFPKLDSRIIEAKIAYPDGTPAGGCPAGDAAAGRSHAADGRILYAARNQTGASSR